jgi:DNA-binding MarR family transcriptional regulator
MATGGGATGTGSARTTPSTRADLVELLTVAQREVAAGVTAALAEDGTTLDGYRLLRSLAAVPGRTMSDLAAVLRLPAASVTRLVDAAAEAALAYRLPDPDDGRKIVVHLSEPGRARLARLEALVQAHEAGLARSLGQERVAALVQALREVGELRH